MNDFYINEYLDYLKYAKKYSKQTINSYENNLTKFNNYLKKQDILKVTSKTIEDYINHNSNLDHKTIAHYITVLNSFYKYLLDNKTIKINPVETIKHPKINMHLPVFLTEDEINSLLAINLVTPYDYRNKAMLEILFATGIRISELINLKIQDVDTNNNALKVFGKGSKERIIPIDNIARDSLINYLNNYRYLLLKKNINSDYLFINNLGKNISRIGFYKIIKKEAIRANIKKDISPHTIRHTFATILLKNGADLRVIQELLGHSDIKTTQIYTHLIQEQLKKEYLAKHPRNL
ncbi:MAG: tyrosine recombinase [Bacilli bacterium]|nr:tyrosine recombinase [Bacilli bacterium]